MFNLLPYATIYHHFGCFSLECYSLFIIGNDLLYRKLSPYPGRIYQEKQLNCTLPWEVRMSDFCSTVEDSLVQFYLPKYSNKSASFLTCFSLPLRICPWNVLLQYWRIMSHLKAAMLVRHHFLIYLQFWLWGRTCVIKWYISFCVP